MSARVKSDFETPDRKRKGRIGGVLSVSSGLGREEEKKDSSSEESHTSMKTPNTVSPPDSTTRDTTSARSTKGLYRQPHPQHEVASLDDQHDHEHEHEHEHEHSGRHHKLKTARIKLEPPSPLHGFSDHDKQVRFNAAQATPDHGSTIQSPTISLSSNGGASTPGKRGVVSRRGGRMASPVRLPSHTVSSKQQQAAVMEFKTFRSPPRRRDESDTVPSLCSTGSNLDKKKSNGRRKRTDGDGAAALSVEAMPALASPSAATPVRTTKDKASADSSDSAVAEGKPLSISCDASKADTTSPLKPEAADRSGTSEAEAETSSEINAQDDTRAAAAAAKKPKPNRAISPGPAEREIELKPLKTPTRSPVSGGRFQVLPSLEDAGLRSPVGLFLSPHPPTPSFRNLEESSSFENTEELKADLDSDRFAKKHAYERSPKLLRDQERERLLSTPTDFTTDFGKIPNTAGSFENSNVLAWLQSPTAHGLFSPGGLGSIMNTPRAPTSMTETRTPRTPTVNTSFFFSDVAGLPKHSDMSPKPDADSKRASQRGLPNIICISPLASSRNKNGISQTINTPTNFQDLPSPLGKGRGLSILVDTPVKSSRGKAASYNSSSKDLSLDAVHLAEKDLMEDEDLSVLMQLASSTPRPEGERAVAVSTSDGTHVFRSPEGRKNGAGVDENLPALQLPVIDGKDSQLNVAARLSRKPLSRDASEKDDQFNPPSLSMRSNSSGGREKDAYHMLAKGMKPVAKEASDRGRDLKRKAASKTETSKKMMKKAPAVAAAPTAVHPGPPVYSMPPPQHYPHHADVPAYYSHLPPGMPRGGSMRVVVGAMPPARKTGATPPRTFSMGPGDYPTPHHFAPPPPHGRFPHPHPSHMHARHPYYPPPHAHHRPPPPRMPLYGGQHTNPPKSKLVKKTTKAVKHTKTTKRAASAGTSSKANGTTKKTKKSPSHGKKKNKSPQLADGAERKKAAATIQAVNAASGGKNDRAAALAAAILRGVTMRPSGKWQAQLYFSGKSRYIGVFDTREKAALAYEIAREKLKSEKSTAEGGQLSAKATDAAVNAARKAAFDGVNEKQK